MSSLRRPPLSRNSRRHDLVISTSYRPCVTNVEHDAATGTPKRGTPTRSSEAPPRSWRPRPGLTRTQRSREQDRAAGGASNRLVDVGEGRRGAAHVTLTPSRRTGRVSASLQWTSEGRRKRLHLGEVDLPTRSANLREAWRLAGETGLLVGEDTAGSWASSPATRASMRSNRSRDTKPELRLRSLLHRAGLRYRVSAKPLPHLRRTADVVFTKARVAVFVDGCYWHGCPEHGSIPATNRDFWSRKIEGNIRRDKETDRLLTEAGWKVVRVWEHTPPADAAELVQQALVKADGRGARAAASERTAVQ